VLPPEAGAGVCAPLRDRGRPSCDKLAHPTPPRRIVHDDRNISFLQGLGRRAPAMKMRSISLVAAARRPAALAQGNAAPGITRKK
jgi:hypothetical protein